MNEPAGEAQKPEPAPEPGPSAATPVSNLPAEPSATAPSVTVQCPTCDAKLQKVTVTPGVKVHCLHCGARFFPASAGAAAQTADGASLPDPAKSKVREPQSPGYWLLRVPATIAMTVGIFVTAIIAWNGLQERYMDRLEYWLLASYVPLIALAGILAFFWSRALARIDAGMTREFWARGLLRKPLPKMPGSSLPYIGPFAIVGGSLPIVILSLGGQSGDEIFIGGMLGAGLFLLGFMAEDVHQFAWRQHIAAYTIAPPTTRDRNQPYGDSLAPWTAMSCAAGFGILALLEFRFVHEYWNRGYMRSDALFLLCIGLALLAAAVTGYMLCCNIDCATATWIRTAQTYLQKPDAVVRTVPNPELNRFSYLARWFPVFWAVYGCIWLPLSALQEYRIHDADIWFLISLSAVALALWFSRLIQQFAAWSWAKRVVYTALRNEGKSPPPLSEWSGAVIRLSTLLLLLQIGLMSFSLLREAFRWSVDWRFVFAIPLILGLAHYPTVFVITATREFVALEQSLAKQQNSEDA